MVNGILRPSCTLSIAYNLWTHRLCPITIAAVMERSPEGFRAPHPASVPISATRLSGLEPAVSNPPPKNIRAITAALEAPPPALFSFQPPSDTG